MTALKRCGYIFPARLRLKCILLNCYPLWHLQGLVDMNFFAYKRGQGKALALRSPSPLLLQQLHMVIREQAQGLSAGRRLLLGQELDRVAREQQEARDGRSQLVLRLLQALHSQLGPAMRLDYAVYWALHDDDLPCFLYAHANCNPPREHELERQRDTPMALAVKYGAASVLEYGLQHRDKFRWEPEAALYAAHRGDLRALDLVLGAGCELCNAALSIAAGNGHVACVRYLHERGLPLWDHVEYGDDPVKAAGRIPGSLSTHETVLQVPGSRHHTSEFPRGVCLQSAEYLWGVLRYGQIHGAPVPGWAGLVVGDRREKARAVLLSFHSAGRRAVDGGEHVHLWGLMATVPLDVVHMIVVAADLELGETFKV
jgi:hypothetical protein